MGVFTSWLESNLNLQKKRQIQSLYDLVVKLLLGSARDQTHLPLSDIADDSASGTTPPIHKGPAAVLHKLTAAQVFERVKSLGDIELQRRADQTQQWLQQISHGQGANIKNTVGELLNRLFGNDATEMYGTHTWQKEPMPPQQNMPQTNVPQTPQMPQSNMSQLAMPPGGAAQAPPFQA